MDLVLRGIIPALVTPMKAGSGPDLCVLRSLAERLVEAGVHGLVVAGGTGEFLALSRAERWDVVRAVAECVNGRVPVVAGVLSPGLRDCIDACDMACDAGADAVMVITPFYVKPAQPALVEYFGTIADEVPCPLVLYNIPSRTGVNLEPETLVEIASCHPSVVGIKECAPGDQGFRLVDIAPPSVAVLAGEEHLALPLMAAGAAGAVLASANAIPNAWLRAYRLLREGRLDEAEETYARISGLLQVLFSETNPGPLKALLDLLGHHVGPPRLPLRPASAQLTERLTEELRGLKALEADVL